MDSPLLAVPGAVPADPPDSGVAGHYGDPFAEQRALERQAGVVDRSHRGVVRVTGADRLTWLNSLSTGKVDDLPVNVAAQTLVLSPTGHVEHHLFLCDDGTATWIHVEPGEAGPLTEFLESMRFLMDVRPADVSAEYAVLTLMGPAASAGPAGSVAAALRFPFGTDLVVARDRLGAAVRGLRDDGAGLAGMRAHEALRVAGHRARFGRDTDSRSLPHEMGWIETAVHLDKGCYRGQETVARVHNLGHPPRRLVMLHLDGSVDRLPACGDPVEHDGREVGRAGSAERHFELGPIALALVKRTVPVGATLTVAGIPAAQDVIVSPDAGARAARQARRQTGWLAPPPGRRNLTGSG